MELNRLELHETYRLCRYAVKSPKPSLNGRLPVDPQTLSPSSKAIVTENDWLFVQCVIIFVMMAVLF